MTGSDGWPAVPSSTLRAKNAAKPSAVWPVEPLTLRSLPGMYDNDRQISCVECSCWARQSSQPASFLSSVQSEPILHSSDPMSIIQGQSPSITVSRRRQLQQYTLICFDWFLFIVLYLCVYCMILNITYCSCVACVFIFVHFLVVIMPQKRWVTSCAIQMVYFHTVLDFQFGS